MGAVRWLDDDEQQAWRSMITVYTRLIARLDAELQHDQGLTLPDYEVLVHLAAAPEQSMRMAELAAGVLLTRSGLTRRLDGLVCAGLVERRACPSDRRGSMAALTAKGRARLQRAAPTHIGGVRAYVVDRLDRDQFQALRVAMEQIGCALDATEAPNCAG